MTRTSRIALIAAAVVLASAVATAALTAPHPAHPGPAKSESHSGTELPASNHSHAGRAPESVKLAAHETPETLTTPAPTETREAPETNERTEVPRTTEASKAPDSPAAANHGAEVSATAHATESGPGKGAIVADVASDGRARGEGARGDDADSPGADHAADQADDGSGNAGEHGKP